MKQFLFPAVFIKDEDKYTVVFPNLNITTDGDTIEQAYLFAKDFLRVYFTYVIKFDLEFDLPMHFEDVVKKYPEGTVMLVDAIIDPENL